MGKNTDFGNRMKNYERCYDFRVPARSYMIIRLDGKNFSKYTQMFEKPFDKILANALDVATIELCKTLHPKFAYTQSDEISLLFTDIENIDATQLLDGKVQKLASIAASKFTASFNATLLKLLASFRYNPEQLFQLITTDFPQIHATFDARVFVIPDFREVSNYFIWRQQDCTRNSISMATESVYSSTEVHGKSSSDKQEMLHQKGINWNDYDTKSKRGVVIKKHSFEIEGDNGPVTRSKWIVDYKTPIFTQERNYLYNLIPTITPEGTDEADVATPAPESDGMGG